MGNNSIYLHFQKLPLVKDWKMDSRIQEKSTRPRPQSMGDLDEGLDLAIRTNRKGPGVVQCC